MGSIVEAINLAFRDFVSDGIASSGGHEVVKSEVRAIGPLIEAAIGNIALGTLVDVVKATRADLNADLAYAANAVALVYADPTDANNDLYVKVGASGSGSWTLTTTLHGIIESIAGPWIDLAEAWANGSSPGGAGTKSAKEWAGDAALSSATAEAASGPTYASTAAGLAATTNGQAFAVDAGGGLVSIYLNSAGTAVLQRTLATTAYLASSAGAGAVGFTQGAGAVTRTVQDKLREVWASPEGFGAVGNDSAKDTAAFLAFRDWALTLPAGSVAVLNCNPGRTYLVANPYWPRDIKNLIVHGNGCTIKNSATVNVDKSLLNPTYGTDADGLGTFYTPVNRYLIDTTVAGSTTVTCLTASDAGNFSAGEWVMLGSFDLQFTGQPPNYRFFEYHQVKSVDTGTGAITFNDRVKYVHQKDFPYTSYAGGDGRANIYKIEQGAKWGINHTYNDIVFVKNNVSASGATTEAVYCQGKSITFNRCIAPYFLISVSETVTLNECVQTEAGEFDKLVENIILNGVQFLGNVTSATSVNSIVANRTTFADGYRICPKRIELNDCTVTASSQANVAIFGSYGHTDDFIIKGGSHQFLPTMAQVSTQTLNVTIGVGGVTWTGSTQTLYVPLDSATRQVFASQLYPGAIVCVATENVGRDYSSGVFGTVRSVTGVLGGASAIIDFTDTLAGTEKLTVFAEPLRTSIDVGGISRDYTYFRRNKYERRNLLVTSGFSDQNIPVFGRPKRVIVDVKRAYTGATTGNILLNIINIAPSYSTRLFLKVDLKTAGRRERTISANSGWSGLGGETAAGNLSSGGYSAQAFGSMTVEAYPAMDSTDNSQLPIVDVLVEFESPYSG